MDCRSLQFGGIDRGARAQGSKPLAAPVLPLRINHAAHPEVLTLALLLAMTALEDGDWAVVIPADTLG